MACLYSELYDLIIDYLADDTPTLTACSLVSHHITFHPCNNRCADFFEDKAPLVEELTIYGRLLPGDKGMRTDAWTEALRNVLPLLISLRRPSFSGKMYLDAMHRVRSGVQGVLAQLTSLTLDGVFFSTLAELGTFFGRVPHLRGLAVNVITVGRGDDDDGHDGGLSKELETLKVGIGHLHITPVPDISRLRYLTVFIPLAYTNRHEVRRALLPKSTKVNTADIAICALDWTRRMLDTGSRSEEVAIILNVSSVVDGEGVREAWARVLRPNIVVRVEGDCSETIRAWVGNARVALAEGKEAFYEL
ncbi:hypothetical protein EDD85DRAFT_951578 [Armillaria nabsnona]|nr:hypothetical protein EDD85DRAFT_951578 [Armillaria nabsnona]